MGITKRQALTIIFSAARSYQENLVNRGLLFVCTNKHKHIFCVEVTFDQSNFKHLTGLKTDINARHFFNLCLNQRLSENDFEFSNDGTTQLKMKVLPQIVTKNLSATMIGDYNKSGPQLYTEKVAGNISACIGFVRNKGNGRYVPNTLLKGDIRNLTKSPDRIIMTYRKRRNEEKYSELVYHTNKINWNRITLPDIYKYLPLPSCQNTK